MNPAEILSPFCRRQAESLAAIAMAGAASVLVVSPSSLEHGGFHLITHLHLTAYTLAAILIVSAACRFACLLANGRWPYAGPPCRVVCAVIGMLVWVQMGYSLWVWTAEQGYISLGVPIYGGLALSELITLYRVVRDGYARG